MYTLLVKYVPTLTNTMHNATYFCRRADGLTGMFLPDEFLPIVMKQGGKCCHNITMSIKICNKAITIIASRKCLLEP